MYLYHIAYILNPAEEKDFKIFFQEELMPSVFEERLEMQFWKVLNDKNDEATTLSQQIKIKSLSQFVAHRETLEAQIQQQLLKFRSEVLFFTTLLKSW